MPLNEQQKQDYLSEALDSQKVILYCKTHQYFGPAKDGKVVKPHKGCPQCWMVFYMKDIASAPPHLRGQRLAELEEVLHKVVEMVEKGTWDFQPYEHARIKTSTDNA